jgi:thiol-disulfide isomerase/thioredoxin
MILDNFIPYPKAMKRIATGIFLLICFTSFAQPGYEIKITLKPFKNQWVYLGHYYGKQLPIVDSVMLDEKSQGVFKGNDKLGGGIYLVGFPDRAHNFEVLIDKNQYFSIIADTATLAEKISFVNSPENVDFINYQQSMSKNGVIADSLYKLRTAHPKDSIAITKKILALNEAVNNYRNNIIHNNPNSLLAVLLQAMKEPDVPANPNPSDSLFAYRYFKNNYWNGVNFYDDRLARTPFFESRIDKYFDQLVYPSADSVIKEIDWMMGYASINKEMEKFLLLKFVNRYLNQKYMWEDAVFVHLFEKYFSQKEYDWVSEKGKKLIQDRAYSLMANIFGRPASDVELPDSNGKTQTLYSINSPYTLVVIWDPTCGHCKETVPKLDSLYKAKWKKMGLQPFGLAKETDGSKKDWLNFMREKNLSGWINVYYSKESEKARIDKGVAGYSQLYDVQSFPTLYLLDKDKRIIAKKVTVDQIDEILDYRQKHQGEQAKK